MSGINIRLRLGPNTYQASVAILGGQGVEADPVNVGRIRPWSAGTFSAIGVALTDGLPTGSDVPAVGSPLSFAVMRPDVACAYGPAVCRMTYSAAANFGDRLVASANGQVAPAGVAPDARTLVGMCDEPNGVGANGLGHVRLR